MCGTKLLEALFLCLLAVGVGCASVAVEGEEPPETAVAAGAGDELGPPAFEEELDNGFFLHVASLRGH